MTPITIPQLDANVVDVTVTRWHKRPGDTVKAGEGLAELTTDKAVYELEAPADGTLLAVYAAEKSVVPTGFTVGVIGQPGEVDTDSAAVNEAQTAAYRGAAEPATPADAEPARDRGTRIRATPRARRLALEKGLDLARIQAETGAAVIDETVLAPYLGETR
ncbi:MAG: Dihydrolipoyllysine-residue succinyltransferase component of 2-oxoglutarate dehydrogenase complex [Lentisphaerae bacterium ADurb.BinA184]|nr:MAG: Dihydrolipoyllysine-residue succinyltransferase component of 2-oxoglutarate dehydrogenase complex [Lentisphaerae bacterium ADurb.BinA184]